MKALVCELCGSNDIMKQDGCFVCQHCGTKYSVEEARKMMIEGSVEVQGTVRIDNSGSVKNYLEIGNNALLAGNGKQAENYANKALEVDPRNTDAWALKMRSYEYTATFGDVQVEDICAAAINVIEYASDREAAEKETYNFLLDHANTLLLISKAKLEDVDELKKSFQQFMLVSLLSAAQNTAQVDGKYTEPIINVAESAVALTKFVPDDALLKYKELPQKLLQCADTYSGIAEATAQRARVYLVIASQQALTSIIDVFEPTAKSMRKRAMDAMRSSGTDFLSDLRKQLDELNLRYATDGNAAEYDELVKKISELWGKYNSLGLFKKQEKKAIEEEMKAVRPRKEALEPEVVSMRIKLNKEIEAVKKQIALLESTD